MEINGIAHIQLTVNDLQRAMPFYEEVLAFMGMQAVVKNPEFLYMIGGRAAVAITRCSPENRDAVFDQRRIGLHHVCFRARSREDVDSLYEFLRSARREDRAPAHRGLVGAGLLLAAVRRSRGHPPRSEFRPGQRVIWRIRSDCR